MLPLGSRFSRLVFLMNSDLPIRHSAFTWRVDRLVAVVLYAASVITVSVFLMHGWDLLWAAWVLLFWGCFATCSSILTLGTTSVRSLRAAAL